MRLLANATLWAEKEPYESVTERYSLKRILTKKFQLRILTKFLEDIWWSLLLLNLKAIHKLSNWLCWKAQEKFQVEFRICKAIGYSYVTFLTA